VRCFLWPGLQGDRFPAMVFRNLSLSLLVFNPINLDELMPLSCSCWLEDMGGDWDSVDNWKSHSKGVTLSELQQMHWSLHLVWTEGLHWGQGWHMEGGEGLICRVMPVLVMLPGEEGHLSDWKQCWAPGKTSFPWVLTWRAWESSSL
jgi:hypothetical protein